MIVLFFVLSYLSDYITLHLEILAFLIRHFPLYQLHLLVLIMLVVSHIGQRLGFFVALLTISSPILEKTIQSFHFSILNAVHICLDLGLRLLQYLLEALSLTFT